LIKPQWYDPSGHLRDSISALEDFGAWGGVFHGFNSTNDAFGWGIDLGAAFELVRWYNQGSLLVVSDMELTAKTNNDIYFNPKGGFWEEGILFTNKTGDGSSDIQYGYLHRCRHDVGNGDTTQFTGIPNERTLIYGSLTFRDFFGNIALGESKPEPSPTLNCTQISPWLSGDLYVFREDYRQPASTYAVVPDFSNILFTISGGAYGDLANIGSGYLYSRASAGVTAFGTSGSFFRKFSKISKVTLDGDVEVGYAHNGAAAKVEFYLGWQGFNDDASNPLPVGSHFLTLGFRFTGSDLVQ
jgi:hypothetical protein